MIYKILERGRICNLSALPAVFIIQATHPGPIVLPIRLIFPESTRTVRPIEVDLVQAVYLVSG
jgi:hypothetical protein